MKIAILYDVAYPYSIGGGEKINWELGRRLARRGHEVWTVSSHMWDGPAEFERDGMRYAGICRWLKTTNNLGNRSALQPFLFALAVFRFLRRARFDAVMCNAFPYLSCVAARFAAFFNPAALVITWYEARGWKAWWNYAGFLGLPAAVLERLTARLFPRHNTISDFTAERMTRLLGIPAERIQVVPCGVDVEEVRPGEPAVKKKEILYVGRVVKHKRVDTLMDAFFDLAQEFPDYNLKIVGPGAEREALQEKAQSAGMSSRVIFLDTLTGPPLYAEFQQAHVFVLPSDQEGFGMVLLEAMAAGTPVIAKKAEFSAVSSVIRHGENGLLFATRAELAEQIRILLTDRALYNKLLDGGCETAARYDWDTKIVPDMERHLMKTQMEGGGRAAP